MHLAEPGLSPSPQPFPVKGGEGQVKYEAATDITLTPALSLKGEGVCWSAITIDRTFTYPCQPVKGEGVTQSSPPYRGTG